MTEEEYRAEMAKQARIANLIALRELCNRADAVGSRIDRHALTDEIIQLVFVA